MIVCVHQPQVFPSVHLLQRYVLADVVIVMDRAQINRKVGMAAYTIGPPPGLVLRVPLSGGSRSTCEAAHVLGGGWKRQHLEALRHRYAREGALARRMLELVDISIAAGQSFGDVGVAQVNIAFQALTGTIDTSGIRVVKESQVDPEGTAHDASDRVRRLVRIARGLDPVTWYLCGQPASRPYLREADFAADGIRVHAQAYGPPPDGNLSWLHYFVTGGSEGLGQAVSLDWPEALRRRPM